MAQDPTAPRHFPWVYRVADNADQLGSPLTANQHAIYDVARYIGPEITHYLVRTNGMMFVGLPDSPSEGRKITGQPDLHISHTSSDPDQKLPEDTYNTAGLCVWLDQKFASKKGMLPEPVPKSLRDDMSLRVKEMCTALEQETGVKPIYAKLFIPSKNLLTANSPYRVAVVLATNGDEKNQHLLTGAEEGEKTVLNLLNAAKIEAKRYADHDEKTKPVPLSR